MGPEVDLSKRGLVIVTKGLLPGFIMTFEDAKTLEKSSGGVLSAYCSVKENFVILNKKTENYFYLPPEFLLNVESEDFKKFCRKKGVDLP